MARNFFVVVAMHLFLLMPIVGAQLEPAAVHSTSFNSSWTLTDTQVRNAQLDSTLVESIQTIMNFDRTQMAFGGPSEDDFYPLPPLSNYTSTLEPGQVLRVQRLTDPTAYSIPPNTALSRILYTTTDFNGTVIPSSGFILWPFAARRFTSSEHRRVHQGKRANATSHKAPVAVWAHGTSGFFKPQAPSAHRALWYANSAPFALAQAGYAVFAPDYAGLGVVASWNGTEILHQYSASPTTARDALYGLRAALGAFPETLDSNWMAMGHSQGGGVAWAVAEAMANEAERFSDLVAGYRCTIAASPTTRLFDSQSAFVVPSVGVGLRSIFPTFHLSDWLTPLGVARMNLAKEIGAGIGVIMQLMMLRDDIIRPDWNLSWYADAYSNLANAGRKDFRGPLLVLQGTDDDYVLYNSTATTVRETTNRFPDRNLEFLVVQGAGHVPVLDAARHLWLQWIDDRFEGKVVVKGYIETRVESLLPARHYLRAWTSFPLWAGLPRFSYEIPLAV